MGTGFAVVLLMEIHPTFALLLMALTSGCSDPSAAPCGRAGSEATCEVEWPDAATRPAPGELFRLDDRAFVIVESLSVTGASVDHEHPEMVWVATHGPRSVVLSAQVSAEAVPLAAEGLCGGMERRHEWGHSRSMR